MDNILEFHKQIESHYKEELVNLQSYEELENKFTYYLTKNWISQRVRNHLIIDQKEIQEKIKNINSIKFYFIEIRHILKEYVNLMQIPTNNSFFQNVDNSSHSSQKQNIIKSFWEIFNVYKQYCQPLKNNTSLNKNLDLNQCHHCHSTSSYFYDETVTVCYNCMSERIYFLPSSTSETIRSNKYIYDRNQHFRDCIIRFQGKQKNNIPSDIIENINKALMSYRVVNISLSHICMILKNLGYSKYYEDYVLIHNIITGQIPLDISHLEEQLLQEFDIINMELTLFKELNNKNFNTQYMLFLLLKHHNVSVDPDHLILIKCNERKLLTDKICRNIFKSLGWKFKSII